MLCLRITHVVMYLLAVLMIGTTLNVATGSSATANDSSSVQQETPATPNTTSSEKSDDAPDAPPQRVQQRDAGEDCMSSVQDTPDSLTVRACVASYTDESSYIKSHIRAKVKGKTQLSYVKPGTVAWSKARAQRCRMIFIPKHWYNGSKASVEKRIRTYVVQRLSIVNGYKCVRLKHDSWWFNSGMNGKRKQPVLQQVHGTWSLMVQNRRTGALEHYGENRPNGYWLVCGNTWIWVAIDYIREENVVWAESEDQVIMDVVVEGESGGGINLSGTKQCPGGTIDWSLYVYANGSAIIRTQLKQYVIAKMSGPGYAEASSDAIIAARAIAVSKAVATLDIKCDNPPDDACPDVPGNQPPGTDCNQPEPKYVTVTCEVPEEIFVGSSYLVRCFYDSNTGRVVSVSAASNDSNSRITGVNCTVSDTTLCPPGSGEFQFRIQGLSEGFTSFTARATSGGIAAEPFVSDPFPVDPNNGGFDPRSRRGTFVLAA